MAAFQQDIISNAVTAAGGEAAAVAGGRGDTRVTATIEAGTSTGTSGTSQSGVSPAIQAQVAACDLGNASFGCSKEFQTYCRSTVDISENVGGAGHAIGAAVAAGKAYQTALDQGHSIEEASRVSEAASQAGASIGNAAARMAKT